MPILERKTGLQTPKRFVLRKIQSACPRTHHGGTRTSACRRTLAPTMPILERKTGLQTPKNFVLRKSNQHSTELTTEVRAPARAGARLLRRCRFWNARRGCKHPKTSCCENLISTPQNSPRRYAHQRVPAHACSDDADFGTKDGLQTPKNFVLRKSNQHSTELTTEVRAPARAGARLLRRCRFWNERQGCKHPKGSCCENLISTPHNSPRRYAPPARAGARLLRRCRFWNERRGCKHPKGSCCEKSNQRSP